MNDFRSRIGLKPWPLLGPYRVLHDTDARLLFGLSPAVFPRPSDWPAHAHVTGYWLLDPPADWTPPDGLAEFLESDPKPVYVSFGSMRSDDTRRPMELIADALARARQRAVIAGAPVHPLQGNVTHAIMPVHFTPHSWLFPRTSAVVHHGGVDTTAAGLRAGVPSVVVPFLGGQHYWGGRVAELGVGPKPIRYRELTAEALADRIDRATSDSAMRLRAREVAGILAREDGVGKAVELICSRLARR